jgi:hypothetical protein
MAPVATTRPTKASRHDCALTTRATARRRARVLPLLGALLGLSPLGALTAQGVSADVVEGRVLDDSAHAVIATVKVTRGPDRQTREIATDSAGRFRTQFDSGTGDYLVYASAPGLRSARRRVQAQPGEHRLRVDLVLAHDLTVLASVHVTAVRPERAVVRIGPGEPEPGASEQWSGGVNGQLPPTVAGELRAFAGTFSGVVMTPDGPSVVGASPATNLNTLNGMALGSGSIPRAARAQTRLTTTTYDATRGGFAGANIDVRMERGDREFQHRTGFLTADPVQLQFVDASSRLLGSRQGGFRASVAADGEMLQEAATYNVAIDVSRSVADGAGMVRDASVLRRLGVHPDSLAKLLAVAAPLGIPIAGDGVPQRITRDAVSWLGRFDDTRDSLRTRALTTYAGLTRAGGVGASPLATSSTRGERLEHTYGAQLLLDNYLGAGRRVLNETRFAANTARVRTSPYVARPGATVALLADGLDGANMSTVTLGGGSLLSADDTRWSAEGANETVWNARGRRHRFKALLWARTDGLRQTAGENALGSLTYASLADVAAERPSSFSRALRPTTGSGTVWNTSAAVVHQYAPTRHFGLLYGVRLDGSGFAGGPPTNQTLDQSLGVRSGAALRQLHLSPRLGFTYTYDRSEDNNIGTSVSPVGVYVRRTSGTVRGGIGDFRALLQPDVLTRSSIFTGLPGEASRLSCVGAAVPRIDWKSFNVSSTIPDRCANGSGSLADSVPQVSLVDPNYQVPHSWRASLEWTTNVASWMLSVEGLASYDLALPGAVDRNFAGAGRLTLPAEDDRSVFVPEHAIDAPSGLVSPVESRRSSEFGRVTSLTSDLRGYGSQLTVTASPDVLKFKSGISLFASTSYTLRGSRRQYRGFDGAAFGDPRAVEWAPSGSDARHTAVFTGGLVSARLGVLTMFARLQSGLPFSPLVAGDVNGDGLVGDRAFVPHPSTSADPALEAGLSAVLSDGSPVARRCLTERMGQASIRNACRGPWTQMLNVQWRPTLPKRWGDRLAPSLYFENILAGADQLLHGTAAQRGWGASGELDPVLLVPRGFDAATRRFRYDVNPRFAETRPGGAGALNPFRIVIDISADLSTPYTVQQLRRAVEPIRIGGVFQRRSADSIAAFYVRGTSSIHTLLLEESDSLFLSATQIRALRTADSVYTTQVNDIYRQLGAVLARADHGINQDALDSVNVATKAYWHVFALQPDIAGSILTRSQRELIRVLAIMLEMPLAVRERAQFRFDHPVRYTNAAGREGL